MAERKAAVADPPAPIDIGLDGSDMGIPVLSITHTSSKAFKKGRAKFGDIIVGQNSDDTEAQVLYSNAGGDKPLHIVFVGPVEKWLSTKYKPGSRPQRWEFGDETAPMDAETNYRYTLLVPAFSDELPVHFYVKGSGIRALQPTVNKLKISASKGIHPAELAFNLSTEHIDTGELEWYVPVLSAAEPDPSLIEAGREFFAQISNAQRQKSLTSNTSASEAPSY